MSLEDYTSEELNGELRDREKQSHSRKEYPVLYPIVGWTFAIIVGISFGTMLSNIF